jgi:hypothetical protein
VHFRHQPEAASRDRALFSETVTMYRPAPSPIPRWRERRLTFESRPLGEVVAEFNLYNEHPIEISDSGLESTQVSGSFNANDPQSFALFLEESRLAKPRMESDKILLMPLAARKHKTEPLASEHKMRRSCVRIGARRSSACVPQRRSACHGLTSILRTIGPASGVRVATGQGNPDPRHKRHTNPRRDAGLE